MASNSNVIKIDFEYTSTVVAKLVVKIVFSSDSLTCIQLVANPVDLPWYYQDYCAAATKDTIPRSPRLLSETPYTRGTT